MKAWLKGGLIASGILIGLIILFIISKLIRPAGFYGLPTSSPKIFSNIFLTLIGVLSYPIIGLFTLLGFDGEGLAFAFFPMILPLTVLFWFIVGSIIGWLIGRRRSKKKKWEK